ANVRLVLANVAQRLRPGGTSLIFESVCPPALAVLHALLYPLTSRPLIGALRFIIVRMVYRADLQRARDASWPRLGAGACRPPKARRALSSQASSTNAWGGSRFPTDSIPRRISPMTRTLV